MRIAASAAVCGTTKSNVMMTSKIPMLNMTDSDQPSLANISVLPGKSVNLPMQLKIINAVNSTVSTHPMILDTDLFGVS